MAQIEMLPETTVSLSILKADGGVHLFKSRCIVGQASSAPLAIITPSGAAEVIVCVTPTTVAEIACPASADKLMAAGSNVKVVMAAFICTLEIMEEEPGDPGALRLQFTGISPRVYRMGSAKLNQLVEVLQARLIERISYGIPTSAPTSRWMMCALDFDRTITRKEGTRKDPDIAALIGNHRLKLLQGFFKYLAQSGVMLVVVSLNHRKVIVPVLTKMGVLAHFSYIYDSREVSRFGSKQNLMLNLMQQHSIRPNNCVLVDDLSSNLIGAPCKTVHVREERGIGPLECHLIVACLGLDPGAEEASGANAGTQGFAGFRTFVHQHQHQHQHQNEPQQHRYKSILQQTLEQHQQAVTQQHAHQHMQHMQHHHNMMAQILKTNSNMPTQTLIQPNPAIYSPGDWQRGNASMTMLECAMRKGSGAGGGGGGKTLAPSLREQLSSMNDMSLDGGLAQVRDVGGSGFGGGRYLDADWASQYSVSGSMDSSRACATLSPRVSPRLSPRMPAWGFMPLL